MTQQKEDLLHGTLDLLVLKTLDAMISMHGYGIAQRIQQISRDALQLNQGTLYPALVRLQQRGWIQAEWGDSENKRKAKYYSLTNAGRERLAEETESWSKMVSIVNSVLEAN